MKKTSLLLLSLFACILLKAQNPGELDPSFGNQGVAQFPVSASYDMLYDVTQQADGKLLTTGRSRQDGMNYSVTLTRHNDDGLLDPTFGDNGIVAFRPVMAYGNYSFRVRSLEDGKILVSGYIFDSNTSDAYPMLVKLNNDGSLDDSFADAGVALLPEHSNAVMEGICVQSDGKIVLGGYIDDRMSAIRFTADGHLDTSFGENGYFVAAGADMFYSYVSDCKLQSDGKIVLAGYVNDFDGINHFTALRLNQDGTLDQSFGNDGITTIIYGQGHDFCTAVAIQSDDKIVMAGHTWIDNIPTLQYDFLAMRLNLDGTLDTSYGQNGFATTYACDNAENYILDMTMSGDDKIYGAGYYVNGYKKDIAVVSFDQNGAVNSIFGQNGVAVLDHAADENIEAVCLQSDGKLVVGGYVYTDDGADFLMARFYAAEDDGVEASNEVENAVVVYPNPAENSIMIANDLGLGDCEVNIFEVSGRLVKSVSATDGQSIDVSNLASGSYIVKLTSASKVLVSQFVKK